MIKLIVTIFVVILCIALPLWHRRLMKLLHSRYPEVWQQLGGRGSSALWQNSIYYPFWSWRSLFFLLAQRYGKLKDPSFSREAASFTIAFFVWLALIAAPTLIELMKHLR